MLNDGFLKATSKAQRMFTEGKILVVGDALQICEDVLDLHQAVFEAGH